MDIRFGIGYDVHRYAENRKLFLGGVEIPFEKGLLGHSDADVLLHAISDALLGAAALGDIGQHFPDTDDGFKDMASGQILSKCYHMVQNDGYVLNNLDCVLMLEQPKIAPYIQQMRKKIANILWCDTEMVSIKATTTEKLGFIGRMEGVAATAIVSITKKKSH